MSNFDRHLYSHNHIKGCWEHHVEWCPKYRFNALLGEEIKGDCEAILQSIAIERNWEILELAVMTDHIHLILRTHQPMNPSEIIFHLKGRSAYELFKKHPELRNQYWGGHLWSRGSFIRNIGVDIETERRYVREHYDIRQTSLKQWA